MPNCNSKSQEVPVEGRAVKSTKDAPEAGSTGAVVSTVEEGTALPRSLPAIAAPVATVGKGVVSDETMKEQDATTLTSSGAIPFPESHRADSDHACGDSAAGEMPTSPAAAVIPIGRQDSAAALDAADLDPATTAAAAAAAATAALNFVDELAASEKSDLEQKRQRAAAVGGDADDVAAKNPADAAAGADKGATDRKLETLPNDPYATDPEDSVATATCSGNGKGCVIS